jgi:serine/threonine-protein kinase
MLHRGQIFAERYRIDRRIAQGGMGVIYAAEHLMTEERVALKVLWPHVLGSKATVESFQLEARVTARLGSEHIVRVLDAGFDREAGVPFLVMELLTGMTLHALVGETGPLAPAEVLAVMGQVAEALDRAHGWLDRAGRPAPIVHRDLKPENLFVSVRGGGAACVKVLDFGIAKVLSATHHEHSELRGTPLFMACEQFLQGPITPQLDLWALGLIAFTLLTGRDYWLSAAAGAAWGPALLNEILMLPLAPPSERAAALGLRASWPPAFDAWFLRCLERDPAARYPSAGAAVDALLGAFASEVGPRASAIEAAASRLGDRVALGLAASMRRLEAVAQAEVAVTRAVGPGGGSANGSLPNAAAVERVAPREAPHGRGRLASAKARALEAGAGAVFGIAAALGVAFAARPAPRGGETAVAVARTVAGPAGALAAAPAPLAPAPAAPDDLGEAAPRPSRVALPSAPSASAPPPAGEAGRPPPPGRPKAGAAAEAPRPKQRGKGEGERKARAAASANPAARDLYDEL